MEQLEDNTDFIHYNDYKNDGKVHIGLDNVKKRLKSIINGELIIESEIGKGTISAGGVVNKILGLSDNKLDDEAALKQYSEEQVKTPQRRSRNEYAKRIKEFRGIL